MLKTFNVSYSFTKLLKQLNSSIKTSVKTKGS